MIRNFRWLRILIALTISRLMFVVTASAQGNGPPTNSRLVEVRGVIVDAATQQPLAGADVRVVDPLRLTLISGGTTDARGVFGVAAVLGAPNRVRVRRLGYTPRDTTIIVSNDSVEVVIGLTHTHEQLGTVFVLGTSRARAAFDTLPSVGALQVTANALRAPPPILETDLLRTVQTLPGVVARNDRTVGLNVQGGETDQNLFLLDGVPVFNPDHFAGVFGAFVDDAVGQTRFEGAGFGARYGGRLSSVLDVATTTPERPGVHGTGQLSLLSSSAAIGGAMGGGRGSWELGVRRTYLDVVSRLMNSRALPYHFADVQGRATYALPGNMRLTLSVYRSSDVLHGTVGELEDTVEAGSGRLAFDRGNTAMGVSLTRAFVGPRVLFGDSTVVELRGSYSRYTSHYDQGDRSFLFESGIRQRTISGAVARYSGSHVLRAGYAIDRDHATYDLGSPQLGTIDAGADQYLTAIGLYVEDEWQASDRLTIRPGLRYDRVAAAGWSAWEPRLSARLGLTSDLALTATGGRYAQWLHYSIDERAPLQLFDYWVASDRTVPVTTADAGTVGLERWFGHGRNVSLQGFYKRYHNLDTPNLTADPANPSMAFFHDVGRSYGGSLLVRQENENGSGGWLSYTYAIASRRRDDTGYWPLLDRRHTMNAVGSARRGRYLTALHFGYGSGTPYTAIVGALQERLYDPATGSWTPGDALPVHGAYNARRYPAYARLDLSLSRDYAWRGATVSPELSIVNVFNSQNVFSYVPHYDTSPPTVHAIPQLPILPSLGVRVAF